MTTTDDPLHGWVRSPFSAEGISHDCYQSGSGPGVVVLPEIPGLTPEVVGFGNRVRDAGYTVVIPSLFGTPGRRMSAGYVASTLPRLCISREFAAFAVQADRPVVRYVSALARSLHQRTGGPGVGVIGMCFTGGFALAAAVDSAVVAPVASQPAVPMPILASQKADLCMSVHQADVVEQRTRDGLCLLGLRFSNDRGAPRERFDALRARFGDAFEVIEIDSSPGNPEGLSTSAHSVLTQEYRDDPTSVTHRGHQRVLDFLAERLRT